MSIKLLVNPPRNWWPKGAIRADLAWQLFMPDTIGDIPAGWSKESDSFKRWLWNELSRKAGFMRRRGHHHVFVVTPKLTPAAREFLVRVCSFWSNEVYSLAEFRGRFDPNRTGKNVWIPPVVNVSRFPGEGPMLGKLFERQAFGIHSLLSPILGSGKTNIRVYTISEGKTSTRFHSHTAKEEVYLVLKGKGSARIAGHRVPIGEGDLISKPTGTDLPTQLLADRKEKLKILDIEVWPDAEKNSKDLMYFPDHGELDLVGEGWGMMIPSDSMMDEDDMLLGYETGYVRRRDGTWTPKDVPGFKMRRKPLKSKP